MTAQSSITGTHVLTAPAHIRGPMRRETDAALKQARVEWLQSLPRDIRRLDVAAALGISHHSASVLMTRHCGPKPPRPDRINVSLRGIRFGVLGEAVVNGMTWEQQDALEARCAKTGETMAEALVAFWAEAHN